MTVRLPHERVVPRRRITGMSAVLVPLLGDRSIDWTSFERAVERTVAAGLTPAVNMDTGYVQLLAAADVERVLDRTAAICGPGGFVAGAFVTDGPADPVDVDAYRAAVAAVTRRGGTPVVFPSHGLNALDGPAWIDALAAITVDLDRFIGFELGPMFVPYGRIHDLETYEALVRLPTCVGAKHSSLSRRAEWERLDVRDRVDPDFLVLTGNDLAIDMVTYGSDYLLGLSTMAPGAFAARDRLWEAGDPDFHELNDWLQYLGHFTFRPPVPAYRHDAAMVFELRGWASSSEVPDGVPRRPDSDRAVLAEILRGIDDRVDR